MWFFVLACCREDTELGGGGSLYNSVHRLVLFHCWFALVEV